MEIDKELKSMSNTDNDANDHYDTFKDCFNINKSDIVVEIDLANQNFVNEKIKFVPKTKIKPNHKYEDFISMKPSNPNSKLASYKKTKNLKNIPREEIRSISPKKVYEQLSN